MSPDQVKDKLRGNGKYWRALFEAKLSAIECSRTACKSKRENSNLSVFLEIKPSFAVLSTLTFFIVS